MEESPLISIVIVNWNGARWLKDCLRSLEAQTYPRFEVIVVDNASTDDSLTLLADHFPWVRVIRSTQNLGFAGGNNLALHHYAGEYLVLLNNDTVVAPDYLERFLRIFLERKEVGIAQSKLIRLEDPDKLDTCGSWWTRSTLLYNFGHGKEANLERYNQPLRMFSGKGASLMIRREVIDQVGLFDNAFWCYYEEVDFCHRAGLAGWQVWYWPAAICWHAGGQTAGSFPSSLTIYHDLKNRFRSYLKNFSFGNLLLIMPTALLLNGIQASTWLIRRKTDLFAAYWKAVAWNIGNLPDTLRERTRVKRLRKITDEQLLNAVTRHPKNSYYYHSLFTGLEYYSDEF